MLAIGGGLAVCLWGWTDLQVTVTRYRGELERSARMQIARAALLVLGAVAGAALGTAGSAFAGLTAALVVSAMLFSLMDPVLRRFSLRQASWPQSRKFLSYGIPAAGASTIHLLIPVALRWLLAAATGPVAFGGAALAIDLLQRPFAVALTAFHNLIFPDVIRSYDSDALDRGRSLGAYYENQIWIACLVAGAVIAVLPEASTLLVDPAFSYTFGLVAVPATIMFLFRSWLQNTVSAAAHLAKRPGILVRTAVLELVLVLGSAAGAAWALQGGALEIVWAAALSAFLALLLRLPTAALVSVVVPLSAVAAAVAASLAMALLHQASFGTPIVSLAVKLVLVAFIGAAGYRLWLAARRKLGKGRAGPS
jgi:O-antigen/teichoic acid export membrane protein